MRTATVLTIAVALYLFVFNLGELRYQREHGPALIAEVQRRFTPSKQLLALNPEMGTAEWTATYRPANCTFSNPTIDNCWELHFIVWVPGVPGVMEGRRQVEANFIVDADTREFRTNTRFFIETSTS